MKKPYEEPVLEIMLFSVSMYASSDGVKDNGVIDANDSGLNWWD